MTIARYTFLPWLRRGLANRMAAPSDGAVRGTVEVRLEVSDGEQNLDVPPRSLQLIGPGDVTGINRDQVIRTDPRSAPFVSDFEPNHLVFVEFKDEDFPWRYTPVPPDTGRHRLAPWIVLAVLRENEFEPLTRPGLAGKAIKLSNEANVELIFPAQEQTWAWAHVQISGDLGSGVSPDPQHLNTALDTAPDHAISRLLSPRRLESNKGYHAFILPAFEAGRLAGLGLPLAGNGLATSWASAREFPVYYEWHFRTGEQGDFEELVRRLTPTAIGSQVGIRDMHIANPGFGMPTVSNPPNDVVGLEGALLSPLAQARGLAPASNFATALAPIVNSAADNEQSATPGAHDPVVAPPLYGGVHIGVQRLDPTLAGRQWLHELNADPRYRAAAGLGALVVRQNAERIMKLAWQQAGDILAANRTINQAQLGMMASQAAFSRTIAALPPSTGLPVMAPVLKRVLGSPTTIQHQIATSRLSGAAVSGAFRKLTRPRGLLARRAFGRLPGRSPIGMLIDAVNNGQASAAPPLPRPPSITLEDVAARLAPRLPDWLAALLRRPRLVLLLILLLALLAIGLGVALGLPMLPLAGLLAALAMSVGLWLWRMWKQLRAGNALGPDVFTTGGVAAVPPPSAFALKEPGQTAQTSGASSAAAADFRAALIGINKVLEQKAPPVPPRPALDDVNAHAKALAAITPLEAHPRRVLSKMKIGTASLDVWRKQAGGKISASSGPRMVAVNPCPDIKLAMYEPLRDLSKEFLIPNLDHVPRNALSLLLSNRGFIEAYMAGVNHECMRLALYGEMPFSLTCTWCRQFWDVSGHVNREGLSSEVLAERLKDIDPLRNWRQESRLGTHDNNTAAGSRIVLLMRGDLLKRYPNTFVYAQRARWSDDAGSPNRLVLSDESGQVQQDDLNNPNIKHPQFRAHVEADVHLLGFDLTLAEIRGASDLAETEGARREIPADQLGWFLVIQQVVGEARFGLDERSPTVPSARKFDNLSWETLGNPALIDVGRPIPRVLSGSNPGSLEWGSNAADMANILCRRPIMIAVHARDLLKNL